MKGKFQMETARLFSLPFKIAEAHSWTWVSGIFDESCIAGVTIFIDSRELPKDKNM